MNKITAIFFICILASIGLAGCTQTSTPIPYVEMSSPVPTPSSFSEAISYIKSYSAEERIIGMWAILNYRDKSATAIPLIVENLFYMETSDVRESAARVLGELGNQAIDATPDLIIAMQNDSSINLQNEAARALGKISDKRAIPALADNLYKSDRNLAISSAKAIAMITGEIFSDSASDSGYKLNAQGIPFIVIDAKKWWEEKGQLQDWEYK